MSSPQQVLTTSSTTTFVTQDPETLETLKNAMAFAHSKIGILITGENGCGKEVLTNLIHENSRSKDGNLVTVNCAAIPSELLEGELFGYERGAFTGAHTTKPGVFERANRGTLFLDEIGDMPTNMQSKLLRVLDGSSYRRLGSTKDISVEFRLVCATNAPLEILIQEGKFREDLFYRISPAILHLKPLRERRDDIPLLAEHFLQALSLTEDKHGIEISPETMEWLKSLPWAGNARQLKNAMHRATILTPNEQLMETKYFNQNDLTREPHNRDNVANFVSRAMERGTPPHTLKEAFERALIIKVLTQTKGDLDKAAQMLATDKIALGDRLAALEISMDGMH